MTDEAQRDVVEQGDHPRVLQERPEEDEKEDVWERPTVASKIGPLDACILA
jgi:hypothetical protein